MESTSSKRSPGDQLIVEIEDLADRIDSYLRGQQKAEQDPRMFDGIRSDREKIKITLDGLAEDLAFWL